MLGAVLLDVGGTIWPDHLAPAEGEDPRIQPLGELLPSVEPTRALAMFSQWMRLASESLVHDVADAIRAALVDLRLDPDAVTAPTVVRALCEPAVRRIRLFAGTRNLLLELRELGLRELGLRCVVVSNTEENEIKPALTLGVRAIRVAIKEWLPDHSAAQAMATSLDEVAAIVRYWASVGPPSLTTSPPSGKRSRTDPSVVGP